MAVLGYDILLSFGVHGWRWFWWRRSIDVGFERRYIIRLGWCEGNLEITGAKEYRRSLCRRWAAGLQMFKGILKSVVWYKAISAVYP